MDRTLRNILLVPFGHLFFNKDRGLTCKPNPAKELVLNISMNNLLLYYPIPEIDVVCVVVHVLYYQIIPYTYSPVTFYNTTIKHCKEGITVCFGCSII